jgi:hypothetical protein
MRRSLGLARRRRLRIDIFRFISKLIRALELLGILDGDAPPPIGSLATHRLLQLFPQIASAATSGS